MVIGIPTTTLPLLIKPKKDGRGFEPTPTGESIIQASGGRKRRRREATTTTSSRAIEQAQAEAKAEQAKIQQQAIVEAQAESQRLSDIARQEREERIFAGTIEGQIGTTLIPGAATIGGISISDKPFDIGERPSSAIARGQPILVTKTEAERLKTQGVPEIFITPEAETFQEAIEEGALISAVGLRRAVSPTLETRGATIFNIAEVERFKEVRSRLGDITTQLREEPESFIGLSGVTTEDIEGGQRIKLGEEFFQERFTDIPALAKKRARESFEALPSATQTRLQLGGFAVGGAQALIGLGEFGGSIITGGTQRTFKEGEAPTLFGNGFKFGGVAGEIQTLPKGISEISGQIAVFAPIALLGGGKIISDIRTLGFKGAGIEVARSLTPLRIPSGTIIGPTITEKTQFEGLSLEARKGGITKTIFVGKEKGFPDIKLVVDQLSGTKGGIAISTTQRPIFTIPRGSVDLVSGIQTTQFISGFTGKPTGAIGFIGTSQTIPLLQLTQFEADTTLNIFKGIRPSTTEFAGVKQFLPEQKELFGFASGEKVFGFERTSGFFQEFDVVSGFRKQVSGIGLRLQSPTDTGIGGTGIKIFRGGGGRTPFSQTFAPDIAVVQKTGFGIITGITKPPVTSINGVSGVDLGLGVLSKQDVVPDVIPFTGTRTIFSPALDIREETIFGSTTDIFTGGGTRQRDITSTITTQAPIQDLDVLGKQLQVQLTKQVTKQKQIQEQIFETPRDFGFGRGGFDFGGFGFPTPGILIPPLFPFGERPGRKRKTRGRRIRTRIAPSLFGISRFQFGGITGPLPKELIRGIGILPGQIRFQPGPIGLDFQPIRKPRKKKTSKKKKKKK